MASLSVSTLRARVATAVDAVTGLRLSPYHGAIFGRDTRNLMDGVFSVEVPSSAASPNQRQRRGDGVQTTETLVRVHIAHKFRADAQVSDGDAQTDREEAVLKAVAGVARSANCHLVFDRTEREVSDAGEFLLTRMDWRAIHNLDLE